MAKVESLLGIKTLEALRLCNAGEKLKDGGSLYGEVKAKNMGAISVAFKYTYRAGDKQRDWHIGTWPAMTLAAIRAERNTIRALVAGGADPVAERQAKKVADELERQAAMVQQAAIQKVESEPTMNDLYQQWDAIHGATVDPHWREVRRSHWRVYLEPVIGMTKISEATEAALIARYDVATTEGKTTTARQALALVKQVAKWGVTRKMVAKGHELALMELPKKTQTIAVDQMPENFNIKTYLAKHGEESIGEDAEDGKAGRALGFTELTELLSRCLPQSSQAATGKAIIRFMLATGVRASQAIRLRWAWVSIERRVAIFPAGSMKKRRMHHVHLSEFALEQLQAMENIRINDFVFPSLTKQNDPVLRGNVGVDIGKRQFMPDDNESDAAYQARLAKRLVNRRAKSEYMLYNLIGGKWALYDMRRTVATRLMELTGCDWDVVQRILAHAEDSKNVTTRYTRFSRWAERCDALDQLSEKLMACQRGELPSKSADNVLMLKRA